LTDSKGKLGTDANSIRIQLKIIEYVSTNPTGSHVESYSILLEYNFLFYSKKD
jgi:hypothetical protein